MSNSRKRTISLPQEHTNYIDDLVSAGSYASASEVVRAGLRALQERDAAVVDWLTNRIANEYDATDKDEGTLLAVDDVRDHLRNHRLRSNGSKK